MLTVIVVKQCLRVIRVKLGLKSIMVKCTTVIFTESTIAFHILVIYSFGVFCYSSLYVKSEKSTQIEPARQQPSENSDAVFNICKGNFCCHACLNL